ncbi:Threonyl/alanyl tRNA synthetase [Phycomyces blakesleeanus]|uniref:Threonyl/alanyl tRNA synthetase SAD domain-containing protein n=2 Tax=Phycomyces blakesleeanus TaxID=4837 RepID=A0A162PN70_PHYB8|nr:hypothetical protein PHYBLDRAFT_133339 [Phycomyces blakesleeanus NRRL 1555(-)]OAD74437.1 hypothetical protein PHYBLDRAFT_133339 [Phycomyces blakesleeanus NRRL 1555(-)]|eukprot:XP_018292477.1 hypothetical protein PHYBLDRAFT_133339 [Phycomyces blakesleeanus NRRL 1555(-)]
MSSNQIPVGDLHCQKDTYSKVCITKCISCSEKPNKKGFYEVKLHDTVIFPEGGGQPSDTGMIDNIKVYEVQRKKLEHIHFTKEPVPVNKEVEVTLDWNRRWDHVQQHSGQHLLSAVLEKEPYNMETLSWNLGPAKCYVELSTKNTKTLGAEQLATLESRVNDLILEELPMECHVEANTGDGRPDSLPADYVGGGSIRTITIEGLDTNPCCGTHVRHLGHLQVLKLLHVESARGGNIKLFFLFGQRVLDTLDVAYKTSRQVTSILSVPQEQFVENITKLQQQTRASQKQIKRLMTELAGHTATEVKLQLKSQPYGFVYRPDGDMDFLVDIASALKDTDDIKDKVVVLAAGEKQTGGQMLITGGSEEIVQKTAKALLAAFPDLKGGGKARWQGKAKSWKTIDTLDTHLKTLFK